MAELGRAQFARPLKYCIEYRFELAGRSTDYAENFRGRCLALQSDAQITRLRLLRLEQPRVLDGDHCLVGEGIDELGLTLGERAHFGATNEDHPNCLVCVDQRDYKRCAITELERDLPAFGVFISFGQDVCDVYCSPVDDGTSCNEPTRKSDGMLSDRTERRDLPMVRDNTQAIANHLKDRGVIGIT